MTTHQNETEVEGRRLREYFSEVAAAVALIGLLYFVGLLLVAGFAMTFLSYYQAVGYIDSTLVPWLSAPAPLPQFYWYSVPAPAFLVVTPIALAIAEASGDSK